MAELVASINVHGLKELDRALTELPEEVAGPINHDALTAAGGVIRHAAIDNIHSRTGRTAADIRVEVQVSPSRAEGAAGIGGTRKGRGGRAHVLRWLEFGTQDAGKPIRPKVASRREITRTLRALARLDPRAAVELARGVASGRIRAGRRALLIPGVGPRASAKHHGIAPQSPLTRALAEHGEQAVGVYAQTLMRGLQAFCRRVHTGSL